MKALKRSLRGLLAGVVLLAVLPATEALAAPTVQLLNPSGYSPTIRLSDKEDADETYHLSAWAGEVPSNALVEFELATPATTVATVTGTQAGADTWQGDLDLSAVADAQYLLRAILYEGFVGPGTGTEVARSDPMTVLVNGADVPPPPPSETVEITYPDNGGPFGFYTPPGKRANAVIEGAVSDGTNQVRALYTLTDPGRTPEWEECGSGEAEEGVVRAKCTLQDDGPAARVKAVALVANSTPAPGTPVAAADETGDAHRVVPYVQSPASVQFDPESRKVDEGVCFTMVATALDQAGSEIAGANVDVHAQGPDDQLKFMTKRGEADGFKAPDKAHGGLEPTGKCAETDADNSQGDHNVPGASDEKHIESTGGTAPDGSFTFVLRSGLKGGTILTAWVDGDDDDLQGATEASGGAQLGWGTAPPEPPKQLIIDPRTSSANTGECKKITAVAKQGGNALGFRDIDVHATGPEGVAFCTPEGGSNAFPPDSGEHAGGYHSDGTGHVEGQTDAQGSFVFGVTASQQGTSELLVWLDNDADDEFDSDDPNEVFTTGQIGWGGETRRVSTNLSIRYRKGAFSGSARSSENGCRKQRSVSVRKKKRGRDPVVGSDVTNRRGRYKVRFRSKKGAYYSVAAQKSFISESGDTIVCKRDKSRTKRIR